MENGFYNNGRSGVEDMDGVEEPEAQSAEAGEPDGANRRAETGKDALRYAEERARDNKLAKKSAKKETVNDTKQKIANIGMKIATKGKGGKTSGGKTGSGAKMGAANGGENAERSGGFFSGSGKSDEKGKGKGKIWKSSAMVAVVFCVVVFGVMSAAIFNPEFLLGMFDGNIQGATRFTRTESYLRGQAEQVAANMLRDGEFPGEYAADLAKVGIDVGQVTANGEFVRTNVYIAGLDDDEVAANGSFRLNKTDNGSLVVMYDGEIITADNFVAAVNSNPELYADYDEATDISARFYYSEEVNDVFEDMDISRGSFNGWEPTGDAQEDQQQFNETLADVLDDDSNLNVSGYDSEGEKASGVVIKTGDDASEKVSELSGEIKDDNEDIATSKAAELLNAAISSNEPYKAAKAFVAIEEPIQRAKIGDNGPVNEMMNVLTTETEVTYTDVNTGEEVTKKRSILSTTNFAAAVSNGKYSIAEANNYSRDRVLKATNTTDESIISGTTVSTDSNTKSSVVLGMGRNEKASNEVLQKTTSSVAMAATESSAELFSSEVGGNRAIAGGLFLNHEINKKTIGGMAANADTIMAYRQESEKLIAKKAEMERAVKSPFDISSPYTFAGSIVHGILGSYIRSNAGGKNNNALVPAVGTVMDVTSNAIGGLMGGAMADGEQFGECETVPLAGGAECDPWGTSDDVLSSKYRELTCEDWHNLLPDDLDSECRIIERENGEGLSGYITLGADRESTIGTKDYAVCEAWRDANSSLLSKIFDTVEKWVGLYESCNEGVISNGEDENGNPKTIDGVPADVANGQRYTVTDDNESRDTMEKYSGFMIYDTVYSILQNKRTAAAEFREEYYAKHPKDNSAAGIIARRSGMSKAEAQIALDYAERLAVMANYDPSTRYVFGGPVFQKEEEDVLLQHSDAVQASLYCIWSGKAEYADVRNRSFAA